MTEEEFWRLIEAHRPAGEDPDAEGLAAALTERLRGGPVSMVIGFAEQLSRLLYLLDGPAWGELGQQSGDSFLYTRAAVVAAGRAEYERTLADPSAFAPYAEDLVWAEPLLYVPDRAYKEPAGEEWGRETRYSYESYSNTSAWVGACGET
ncbi:DUF4240 domain-containing protein [Streptomyces sp. NPDC048718]|uniref:DUF4240 domain-containing protein n=1 Tax=Streptomyces sp. NPDC048718 TaxID=3365587 RepID=UPI0037247EAF